MIAETQYTDLRGTAAADLSDAMMNKLAGLAKGLKIDLKGKTIVGMQFFSSYISHFSARVIINDDTQKEQPYLIEVETELTKDEFFNCFKRFEVILYDKYGKYDDVKHKVEIQLQEKEDEEE